LTLAIRFGDENNPEELSGMVYFDAVTSYTQNNRGTVTRHPIDGGGLVSDHFTKDNPVFGVTGIISTSDISSTPSLIRAEDGIQTPQNANSYPAPVQISTATGSLSKLLPAAITQFLTSQSPDVIVDPGVVRTDYRRLVRESLQTIMSGVIYNSKTQRFDSHIRVVKLYEYENLILQRIIPQLVLTQFNIREDADSGDALYLDMTFEQVTFVQIKKDKLSKSTVDSLNKKAADKSNKGKQDGAVQDVNTTTNPTVAKPENKTKAAALFDKLDKNFGGN